MLAIPLLVLAFSLVDGSRLDPIVSTNAGVIQGIRTNYGTKFIGIRYGVVDRNNPFGSSTRQPRFDNIFVANQYVECPSYSMGRPVGQIDCLALNVFVPSTASPANRLPVLVWIHGGGLVEGSGYDEAHDPVSLLRNDVIVVSINYRLGPYGFMCLNIPEAPGNQGFKDQVLALRWINENIEAFGGDASRITAFGESAGGLSVNVHLYSPYEQLFHRAIIQSGPALSPLLFLETDLTVPLRLAAELGYITTDIRDALAYLTTVDSDTLVTATFESLIIDSLSSPCLEVEMEGVENFYPEHLINLRSPKVSNTEIIIGSNDQEAIFQYHLTTDESLATFNFTEFVSLQFILDDDTLEAADHVRHFYIGDKEINRDVRYDLSDFITDYSWTHPSQRMAEQFLDDGAPVVYRYVFSYSGGRNPWKTMFNLNITGATHTDELGYLFDLGMFEGVEKPPEDQLVFDRMTTLWTNFAKFGNPTPATTELLPVQWKPITKTSQLYFEIDEDIALKARPFHDRMAFWDVFYRLYRNQQKWIRDD